MRVAIKAGLRESPCCRAVATRFFKKNDRAEALVLGDIPLFDNNRKLTSPPIPRRAYCLGIPPSVSHLALGDGPLSTSSFRFGTLAIISLVVLRIGVGWHFFREGADKIESGKFSSVGFLSGAKGPFASTFEGMIWDADGLARLDKEATEDAWKQYRQRIANHYGFNEDQQKEADAVLANHIAQLNWFFDVNGPDIEEYLLGLERRQRNSEDDARMNVASLQAQSEKVESELAKKRGPWLGTIDRMWRSLESEMNALASNQQSKRGLFALARPGRRFMDSETINVIIPYFDLIVGICLILGLFTRVASLGGACFLVSVIATQWPGAPGALPVYYQTIELLALLVLAAMGAGRFGGLDFFLGLVWAKIFRSNTETQS